MKIEKGKIYKVEEDLFPLYRKGDLFRVIRINTNPYLMPVTAVRLKDGKVYGFHGEEFEVW